MCVFSNCILRKISISLKVSELDNSQDSSPDVVAYFHDGDDDDDDDEHAVGLPR